MYVGRMPPTPLPELRKRLEVGPWQRRHRERERADLVPFLLLGMNVGELSRYRPCKADPAMVRGARARPGGDPVAPAPGGGTSAIGPGTASTSRECRRSRPGPEGARDQPTSMGTSRTPTSALYGVVGDAFSRRAFCLDIGNVTDFAVVMAPGGNPDLVKAAMREIFPDGQLSYASGPAMLALASTISAGFRPLRSSSGFGRACGARCVQRPAAQALERAKEFGAAACPRHERPPDRGHGARRIRRWSAWCGHLVGTGSARRSRRDGPRARGTPA